MVLLLGLAGCGGSTACLELITSARSGLTQAKQAEQTSSEQQLAALAAQQAALDAAFDSDVKLAEAGGLTDEQGKPVALTGEWVISARQGYSAAVRALQANQADAQQAHAARLDNLNAADEALQMASELIVGQITLNQDMRQQLLALQRSWINGR